MDIARKHLVALLAVAVLAGCGDSNESGDSTAGSSESSTSASSTSAGSESSSSDSSSHDEHEPLEDPGGVCVGEFNDAWEAWQAARDAGGNTYRFTVHEWLYWGDACVSGEDQISCHLITTLTVSDGVTTARELEVIDDSGDPPHENCPEPYQEGQDDLGTNPDGYPVSTVEDVYQNCCDIANMSGGFGYWENAALNIGDDGLLYACYAEWADDCYAGEPSVTLTDIVFF